MVKSTFNSIPKRHWMKEELWKETLMHVPIPCVDLILQHPNTQEFVIGYRKIAPYKNVWALPGGRMMFGEDLKKAAVRIAREYGMRFSELYLVGVFPVAFSFRSDVAIALASSHVFGDPIPDGKEFSTFRWVRNAPKPIGKNYELMISKWRKVKKSNEFLKLNKIL